MHLPTVHLIHVFCHGTKACGMVAPRLGNFTSKNMICHITGTDCSVVGAVLCISNLSVIIKYDIYMTFTYISRDRARLPFGDSL